MRQKAMSNARRKWHVGICMCIWGVGVCTCMCVVCMHMFIFVVCECVGCVCCMLESRAEGGQRRVSHLYGACVGVTHPCNEGNMIYFVCEEIHQYLLHCLK